MLFLAHTGIPLGAVWLSYVAVAHIRSPVARRGICGRISLGPISRQGGNHSWFIPQIDYRLILLGSVLPDILDKPLGVWLLRDALSNGRILGHTLLFSTLLLAAGFYVYIKNRKLSLLCSSFGCIVHLILDKMWLYPATLLWPVYSWTFEKVDVSHWVAKVITSLVTQPSVYIPEITGAVLLMAFLVNLIMKGNVFGFLRTGKVH